MSDQTSEGPLHCVVGRIRAFYAEENTIPGKGICFASSASKARAIVFRSALDVGFKIRWQDIKVKREPIYDGGLPSDYRNQFFTIEHAERHLQPNLSNQRPAAEDVSNG